MLKAVKKVRIYENIVQQIKSLVAEGKLRVGDQLPPERELSETFQVSRASVREAIRALELMGLVQSRPGNGTFISAPRMEALIEPLATFLLHQKDRLLELLEVRDVIEPQMAYLAAKRATPEDIEKIEGILKEQEAQVALGETAMEADTAFHHALAEAATNGVLLRLVGGIVDLLAESREKALQARGRPQSSLAMHREVLAAVKAGDARGAGRAMRRHIEDVKDHILGLINERPKEEKGRRHKDG